MLRKNEQALEASESLKELGDLDDTTTCNFHAQLSVSLILLYRSELPNFRAVS